MRENSIFSRRSIRKFKSTEIPLEITEKIIKAGAAAPSAKNRQPWKCIVLQNKPKEDLLTAMEAGLFREEHERALLPKSKSGLPDAKNTLRIMREAPVLIAVLNTNGKSPFSPLDADERFTEICDSLSIGAFVENMLLQAEQLHLGTLWIANTCFAYEELLSFLKTEAQLIGAVALGYSDEAPAARPRKELADIVEYLL